MGKKVAQIALAASRVSAEILDETIGMVGQFPAAPLIVMNDFPNLLVMLAACSICTAHRLTIETMNGVTPPDTDAVIPKTLMTAALDLIADGAGFPRSVLEEALENLVDEGAIVDGETKFPQWVIALGVAATPGDEVTPTICASAPWASDLILEYFSLGRSKRTISAAKVDGIRSVVEKCFPHTAPAREFLAMVERCAKLEGRG